MFSALSTVTPSPSFLVDLLFLLKVSPPVVGFNFRLCYSLLKTRDNSSNLMPLHVLSFRTSFLPHPLLYLMDIWLRVRHSFFQTGSYRPRPLFFSLSRLIYAYIYGPCSFWGLDGYAVRSTPSFFPYHSLPSCSACFVSLKYLVIVLCYHTLPRYSLSRV